MRRPSLAALLALALIGASDARAESDACREWLGEHRAWKVQVIHRYLSGAPQPALDEAVFELMQREAFLTSCDTSVQAARGELVGWRLVDRLPDEYAAAVVESVLELAGFDVGLRSVVGDVDVARGPVARTPWWRRGRWRRAR